MKKSLFTKIGAIALGLGLLVTGGVSLAHTNVSEAKAEETATPVYTLDGTVAGTNSAYANAGDITQNEIAWKVTGNLQETPWRIGGKSLTAVDRPIYSQTSLNYAINKIEIVFGTASSVTVNSLTVTTHDSAADAASGSKAVVTKTPTFAASSTVTVDLSSEPQSNKFYRIALNLTISVAKNKYVQLSAIKFYGVASTVPSIKVTNKPTSNLNIGDTGTFLATTENATNPVVTWSSSDAAVLDVATSGAYEAKKEGSATVTASLSCDELTTATAATFDVVVDKGAITIEEANTIGAALSSGATTEYNVTLSGYITSTNPNSQSSGKENALTLSSVKVGETGNSIMIYQIWSTHDLRKYCILNASVTFKGKIQNFSGTIEIVSPTLVSYTDDAIEFAELANSSLDAECAALAVTTDTWDTLAELYNDLDTYAQAKIKAATSSDTNAEIAEFIGRYDFIVAKYSYTDFMARVSSSNVIRMVNDNNTILIIVMGVAMAASLAAAFYFMLRKKKAQ